MTLVAAQLRTAAAQLPPHGVTLTTVAKNEFVAAGKALNAAANDAAANKLQATTLVQDITNAYDASLRNGLPGMREKEWADAYQQPLAHLTSARATEAGNPKMAAMQLSQANAYLAVYAARAKRGVPCGASRRVA